MATEFAVSVRTVYRWRAGSRERQGEVEREVYRRTGQVLARLMGVELYNTGVTDAGNSAT